jgi:hypothetical protein
MAIRMRMMQWSRPYAEPLNPGQVFYFSFRPVMDEQRIDKLVLLDRIYLEGSVEIDVCLERIDALFHSPSKLVHCRLTYDGPGVVGVATVVVACSNNVEVVVSIFCNG